MEREGEREANERKRGIGKGRKTTGNPGRKLGEREEEQEEDREGEDEVNGKGRGEK